MRVASCARASGVSSFAGAFCHSLARLVASPFSCAAMTSGSRPVPYPARISSSISRRSGACPVELEGGSGELLAGDDWDRERVDVQLGGRRRDQRNLHGLLSVKGRT